MGIIQTNDCLFYDPFSQLTDYQHEFVMENKLKRWLNLFQNEFLKLIIEL